MGFSLFLKEYRYRCWDKQYIRPYYQCSRLGHKLRALLMPCFTIEGYEQGGRSGAGCISRVGLESGSILSFSKIRIRVNPHICNPGYNGLFRSNKIISGTNVWGTQIPWAFGKDPMFSGSNPVQNIKENQKMDCYLRPIPGQNNRNLV